MKNLRKIRKAKGLKQKELADLVGLSESSISQYESGAKTPSFEKALMIAEVLDCELADLVSERSFVSNLLDENGNKKAATISDGLNDEQIELTQLIPKMKEEEASALLSYAKYLISRGKSQDGQE